MKLMTLIAILALSLNAFADHHEEAKKKIGHDKEHSHVSDANVDHDHEEAHHEAHDHKAHHPDHKDVKPEKSKKAKK